MILQCPKCKRTHDWNRETSGQPGKCTWCNRVVLWKVLKEAPKPTAELRSWTDHFFGSRRGGFVKVISDKGWQELHPPLWQEDPNGWKK